VSTALIKRKGETMMKKLKNSLIALAGLIAIVGLLALVTPISGRGQGNDAPPARDVNVVNTPSLNVVNTATSPALVRDVGVPLRTPVQIEVNVFIPFGVTSDFKDIYVVPEGKRLVIEHVALRCNALGVGNAVRGSVITLFEHDDFIHEFAVNAQPSVDGPLFVANHPMLAFADPGTTVRMDVSVDEPIGSGSDTGGFTALRGTLSGYLENAQ
jgi:hypothetical protein